MFSKPRYLIAIVTCEKYRARAQAQRETWIQNAAKHENLDIRFFLARQERPAQPDEVYLDCPDGYGELPQKVQLMVKWAYDNNYTKLFKTDDDAYIYPNRLMDAIPKAEYAGHVNFTPPVWCSGFGYWLGRGAMRHITKAVVPVGEWAEDRWVGGVLAQKRIKPANVDGIVIANCIPRKNIINQQTICACEFDPKEMHEVHDGPKGWRQRSEWMAEQRRRKLAYKPPMRGDGTYLGG